MVEHKYNPAPLAAETGRKSLSDTRILAVAGVYLTELYGYSAPFAAQKTNNLGRMLQMLFFIRSVSFFNASIQPVFGSV